MTKTFRLPNGITCVIEERPQSGKVSMQIRIKSGSADETAEENGLTFLMQESCNGGTKTRSREQLADAVESKGGYISTVTGLTSTLFGGEALARHADGTFSILADMVLNPAFDAAEVRKTAKKISQVLDKESKDPGTKAELKFSEAAFAGQAAGENPLGTKELLASFTPEQVEKKHASLLAHPENIIISFECDITAADAEKQVQKKIGSQPAAAAALKKTPINFICGDIREEADNHQINREVGFQAPAANDPDMFAAMMLKQYLSGGMSSPLFQEVREKRGLVYDVHASYSPLANTGIFEIVAGAGKGNAGELISVTMDVLGKVIHDGVSQADLDRTRERYIRGLKGVLETAAKSCGRNAEQISSMGRTVSLDEYDAAFKNVTSDDLRRVCAGLLKDGKYALAGVGPQETMPSAQEIKDMMQAQLKGVTIPAASPATPSAKVAFAEAAKSAPAAAAEPKMTVLKNGMKIVTVERLGNMSCGAWVGVGSDNEMAPPNDKGPLVFRNGSTHMNEHMMFKGTPSYAPGEIDSLVEGQLGGGLNAYTNKDRTAYYFFNLETTALAKIVDICGEMVFKANLDHAEFDGKPLQKPDGTTVKAKGERDVVIEELNMYNDTVSEGLSNLIGPIAYPDQPHGRPILGTEETLRAMTVEELAAYRDEFYVPNNVIFCAAGPVKHEDFVALIESKFGQMPAKEFPPLPVPVYKGGTALAEHRNAALCTVKIMAEGVASSDKDDLAYQALGMLLGGGASSRLNKKIVLEQELTDRVSAGTSTYRNGGAFSIRASLEPEKVKPFVSTVYAEMRALAGNVTQQELEKVQACMEMALLSNLETNDDACDAFASNVQDHDRLITEAEMSEEIQKLTIDDIKRVLKKVLASNPTLGLVVPPGTDPGILLKQDEVIALRDGKAPQNPPQPKP